MRNISTQSHDYYTVPEAAAVLGVNPSTIWRWIKAKKLSAYRVGERAIRIKKADLQMVVRPVREEAMIDKPQVEFTAPTAEELARRQALAAQIRQKRQERVIAPVRSWELVQQARAEEHPAYGPDR